MLCLNRSYILTCPACR